MTTADPAPDTSVLILSTSPPPNEPPPPYPSPDRRTRPRRSTRRRRTFDDGVLTAASDDAAHGEDHEASENTPLLANGQEAAVQGVARGAARLRRQRTLSLTSTLRSAVSAAPSFARTIADAFRPERDEDIDPTCAEDAVLDQESPVASPRSPGEEQRALVAEFAGQRLGQRGDLGWKARWRRYFRPLRIRAYYAALFHLLVLNFPYALLAWVYLFVFTVTGTTTLMALPLGAVLCFLDLIGARVLARGELALQTSFHGPLSYPSPHPPLPIFTRLRPLTLDPEASPAPPRALVPDHSFYRNAWALFTDPTSFTALFYFLVIKPGITVLLTLFLLVFVPLSAAFVLPAPAMLRLVRRLGIWQANIAVEGLYYSHAR